MSAFPVLDGKPLSALTEMFGADPISYGVEPIERNLFFQEVAINIAKYGISGVAFLLDVLPRADKHRLQAILVSFSYLDKGAAQQFLRPVGRSLKSVLSDPDPELVATAVDSIARLGFIEMSESVAPLINHESPFVVGSVLRFLSQHFPTQAKPLLLKALGSPAPIVRQNAIDELDELGYADALPSILALREDPDKNVREAAMWAANHLGSTRR